MAALLEKVIASKIALGCDDREDAMEEIRAEVDRYGSFFHIAKTFGVLVNESAEEFAVQFMNAYNNEIRPIY